MTVSVASQPRAAAELNRHDEANLLSRSQLARWQGLPLAWLDAKPEVLTRDIRIERPVLAMLDAGAAEAEIGYACRTVRLNVTEGAIGVFEPSHQRYTRWRCDAARRIKVDLDLAFLSQRRLLSDEMAQSPLRQNLEFRDPEIAGVLRAMVREVAAGCPSGRLYAESLSVGLASRIWSLGTVSTPRRTIRTLNTLQLQRVDDLIENGLGDTIPLALLADAAGYSAPHFSRLMRSTVGCSPHRYVVRKRLERALRLLSETNLPIISIAAMTGFASQSHLTSTLVRALGTTPAQVRRAR